MPVSTDHLGLVGLMEAAENARFRFTGDVTFLTYEDVQRKDLGCRGCPVGAPSTPQSKR
jgi:hypothetical protein